MEIKAPDIVKEVVEISYTWDAGMSLDLMIDESVGDYAKDNGDSIHVHLAAKPLMTNPGEKAGEEDIVIYKRTLANVITRKRKLRMPSPEEIFEMQQITHPMVPRVQ